MVSSIRDAWSRNSESFMVSAGGSMVRAKRSHASKIGSLFCEMKRDRRTDRGQYRMKHEAKKDANTEQCPERESYLSLIEQRSGS